MTNYDYVNVSGSSPLDTDHSSERQQVEVKPQIASPKIKFHEI